MRHRVPADGLELEVLDEGEGPVVLLVHGFPDSSHLWRHQVPALTAAGLRVIAPDMRGFGASDRPAAVEAYRLSHAVADLVAVLDAAGVERARVVGHDWGAGVAWLMAAIRPERVERLVALSVGHPATARRTFADREKAWYMLLFQFEGIAEELLARDDWAFLRAWLRDEGDVERYVADLSRPGALTAALNWYRGMPFSSPRQTAKAVTVPTLYVWSDNDVALKKKCARLCADYVVADYRFEVLEGTSHWLLDEQPETVADLILDRIGTHSGAQGQRSESGVEG